MLSNVITFPRRNPAAEVGSVTLTFSSGGDLQVEIEGDFEHAPELADDAFIAESLRRAADVLAEDDSVPRTKALEIVSVLAGLVAAWDRWQVADDPGGGAGRMLDRVIEARQFLAGLGFERSAE